MSVAVDYLSVRVVMPLRQRRARCNSIVIIVCIHLGRILHCVKVVSGYATPLKTRSAHHLVERLGSCCTTFIRKILDVSDNLINCIEVPSPDIVPSLTLPEYVNGVETDVSTRRTWAEIGLNTFGM